MSTGWSVGPVLTAASDPALKIRSASPFNKGAAHQAQPNPVPPTSLDLEDQLRYAAARTVIDKTGIAIRSDFELRWAPDNGPIDSPEAAAPSIFNALQQQLGLKLVPATAPLKILVIDSAAKPSAN